VEVGILTGDLKSFVPNETVNSELALPVELAESGLLLIVDEEESVDSVAVHHSEGSGDGSVREVPLRWREGEVRRELATRSKQKRREEGNKATRWRRERQAHHLHVLSLGLEAEEVPSVVVSGLSLRHLFVGLGLESVDDWEQRDQGQLNNRDGKQAGTRGCSPSGNLIAS
jgi:hypothetical protein